MRCFLLLLLAAAATSSAVAVSSSTGSASVPQDCQFTWSDWTICNGVCGTGVRTRDITVTRNADPGGAPCPTDPSLFSESCELLQPCVCDASSLTLPVSWSLAISPWPHEAACRPFAVSAVGYVDFFDSQDPNPHDPAPYVIRTANANAIVAFNGFQPVLDWIDPNNHAAGTSNMKRGTTGNLGDFASDVHLETTTNTSCACAATVTAMLLQELPCDFTVAGGALSGLTLTAPGVYCSDSAPTDDYFIVNDAPLTLVGNSTDRYVFRGIWFFGAYTAETHVILQGGLTAENVINVVWQTQSVYATNHGVGASSGNIPSSANMTFISSVPFNVMGNVQFGRVLVTQLDVNYYGTNALNFYGWSNVLLTANTTTVPVVVAPVQQSSTGVADSSTGMQASSASTGTAFNHAVLGSPQNPFILTPQTAASFMIQTLSVPLFVKNMLVGSTSNFSVSLSPLASNRSTAAILQGLTLKSDIISFTFTPSDPTAGMQSATISINVTDLITVGKTLKWYKFNVSLDAWDLKGGEYNATTGLLEYTTDSFSDWAVLETTDSDGSTLDWWRVRIIGIPLICWISTGAVIVVVVLAVRYCRRSGKYAKLQERS